HLIIHLENHRRGKNSYCFTHIEIKFSNPSGFTFQLILEGIFQRIKKIFGAQDIQTGNEEFDKHFVLKSNNEGQALKIFDAKLCEDILNRFYTLKSDIKLEINTIK